MKHIDEIDYCPINMAEVVLLGIAQDGGRPQAGCSKPTAAQVCHPQTTVIQHHLV